MATDDTPAPDDRPHRSRSLREVCEEILKNLKDLHAKHPTDSVRRAIVEMTETIAKLPKKV